MSTQFQMLPGSHHVRTSTPSMKHLLLERLTHRITALSSEALEGMLQIVAYYEPRWILVHGQNEELNLDLTALQADTLHALEQYVASVIR
ncbi:hypothetical protein H310_04521 [Aphanomyces invadans]|uniref:NET domain-containing protein n=1 Tax=Aphanomyces invadans TaxID=157072 RepID=A0A024UD25_9STRA|nr:hypothetical protein H310_04521 [Aphanomyces invadans]ETW04169.1 hypothetical protein H310_04521 [Aphanomyces invadans]|eukprot:XP_008867125.1 hypothetical protein H310_04521 [Aphanomyces invadans]